MSITDASLNTTIWNEIKDVLVDANIYITASSQSSDTVIATINASYNDKLAHKPQVCIYPIQFDESEWKFSSNEGKKLINVTTECWAGNTLNVDELAQQVAYAVKHNPIDGISLIGITSNYAFNTAADSKFHMKVVQFTFDRE
jgi:hypothetical protein